MNEDEEAELIAKFLRQGIGIAIGGDKERRERIIGKVVKILGHDITRNMAGIFEGVRKPTRKVGKDR